MTLTRSSLSFGALLVTIVTAMSAGCAAPQTHVREIDAQVDPILKQMCDLLDGAKAFRLRVRATMDRPVETGQLAQFHRTSDITAVRPNRLYAVTDSDDGKWTAWYRGKTLTVLDREANRYATEAVPGRTDQMLDYMVEHYDLVVPMADLLAGKTYDSLLANVQSGTYVGLHSVGDVKCHHLLFRQENIDWQIWIDAGRQPLPRKLVITYTQEPDQPQYVAVMDNWDLAPVVSEKTFTFSPPAGANSVPMSELVAKE
ncbi:MAG TPA: DUF2092 domain-containing protein [Phycisphaerae bacterium]|nr:DUF2092 domain-containing protein [Phycisphaerae bacterium]